MALAGSIAQRRINPRGFRHDHSRSDYEGAEHVLWHLVGSEEEFDAYFQLLEIQTKNILNLLWEQVERVAEALLESKTLSEEELERLLE